MIASQCKALPARRPELRPERRRHKGAVRPRQPELDIAN